MSNLRHLTAPQLIEAEDSCLRYIAYLEQRIDARERELLSQGQELWISADGHIKRLRSRVSGQGTRLDWIRKYLREKENVS